MYKSLLIIPGLLACAVAQANDALSLPDSIITASRQVEERTETSAANTVFTRDDIDRLQPNSVTDLLRRVPGLSITTNGGLGSLSGISLRGTNVTQTLVLIDGQRIASASAGQASLEFISVDQIERIEVIRGPRSAIYGSDAIGGVVQIFTRQGREGLDARVKLGVGSNQTFTRDFGLSGGDERTRFALGASLSETDGINRTTNSVGGDRDDDGYRNRAFNASLTHKLTDDVEAGIRLLEQKGNTEYDLLGDPEDDFSLSTVAAHLQWQVSPLWRTRLEVGHAEDRRDTRSSLFPSSYDTYRDSASWLNNLSFSDAHNLQLGADWYEDRLRTNGAFTNDERYNQAAFAQYRFSGEQISAELGMRHDDNEQFGSENTFNGALIFALSDNQQVVASYSEGFRAPTFNDLYNAWGSNPDLRPERSKSYELQWRGQFSQTTLQASAYRLDIDDLILLDSFWIPQNISEARINGLELSAERTILGWYTVASATWLDPRDRSTGKQLPRRPKRLLSIDSDRQFGDFGVGFSVVANSARYNDAANTQELSGFGTLEVRGNWLMSDTTRWDISVSNVLEKDYALSNDFLGNPYQNEELNARLSLTWTPQL
ncbi:MAG: TonB-dependent receptor [Pseudomonadales bacterium]|jgi:vitamin B12 transporter|uniref:TonB-dependent receptor domain-containing protein n=1 Tax=Halopseudomonas aestusnigri TaxID=857252 RepID=UPI000C4FE454|nr:TonB-dependent receptor [Pseudomonadales bacterium]HCP02994.1 TonB-dependent receptor [Pseudomonas sp.]MAS67513.1 TonB-dependent receptor [Pseudomonadales bacterium]MAY07470.1 TonB-dependent receptor [Pseudomonadales bacterium]MAY08740.1 TonB-dependent receptor [Pseudomonadales bacterium]|tara:strand:- start:113 stop:1918 length:1806 start_codon:yes stop_codon:yes gene_type:complete